MKLILASSSSRRAEILRDAGFEFEVQPGHVDETRHPGESGADYVRRLAEEKARAVARKLSAKPGTSPALIVAADTVVVLRDEILGKPASPEEASAMLRRLSGQTHEVYSGLTVLRLRDRAVKSAVETTRVTFAPLTEREIEEYVKSGEPFDKAGAYAIQGRGGKFIARIEGCYFNVVGLPLAKLYSILREMESKGE